MSDVGEATVTPPLPRAEAGCLALWPPQRLKVTAFLCLSFILSWPLRTAGQTLHSWPRGSTRVQFALSRVPCHLIPSSLESQEGEGG